MMAAAAVGIVYSNKDGVQWASYIEDIVKEVCGESTEYASDVELHSSSTVWRSWPQCQAFFQRDNCITIIVATPQLLESIQRSKTRNLARVSADPKRVIFFCCSVSIEEIKEWHINERLAGFDEWTHIIDLNDRESLVRAVITNIKALQPQQQQPQQPPPPQQQQQPQQQPEAQAQPEIQPVAEEPTPDQNQNTKPPGNGPPPPVSRGKRTSGSVKGLKKEPMPEPVEKVQTTIVMGELAKSLKKKKSEPQTINFEVVPNVVKCEGKKKIMMTFETALSQEEMDCIYLSLSRKDDTSNCFFIPNSEITRHNPYTISLTLDSHSEGVMELVVLWNMEGETIGRVLGRQPFTFSTMTEDVECATHLYLELLSVAIDELSRCESVNIADVDSKLNAFFSETYDDIPVLAYSQLFGIYEHMNDCSDSKMEHPTLLHLAARYGLSNVTASLLKLNSHQLALSMTNSNKKTPQELADINKHSTLSEDIQASEMADLYTLYEIMENYGNVGERKLPKSYYKKPFPVPISVIEEVAEKERAVMPGYMTMTGAPQEEGNYTYAQKGVILMDEAYGDIPESPRAKPASSLPADEEPNEAWKKVEEIMKKVKTQELTIRDAAKMLGAWLQENPESAEQKKGLMEQIRQIRKLDQHMQEKPTKKGFFTRMFGKTEKTPTAVIPTHNTKHYHKAATATAEANRDSTTSNSSCGSRDSTSSVTYDSGIDNPASHLMSRSASRPPPALPSRAAIIPGAVGGDNDADASDTEDYEIPDGGLSPPPNRLPAPSPRPARPPVTTKPRVRPR